MKVKIKKLDALAQIPAYAKESDAGMDLTAISRTITTDYVEYGTGLAIEIPEGYVGLVFPRSSISKYHMSLANSVGVIDSGYRGEIKCRFNVIQDDQVQYKPFAGMFEHSVRDSFIYEVGDRIAQLIIIPYPKIELEEVENLTETARGAGGFGSSNAV